MIIAVDGVEARLAASKKLGAGVVIDYTKVDPLSEIMRLTKERGVDVAIEALGTQQTIESCLRALKFGPTLSRRAPIRERCRCRLTPLQQD